MSKPVFKIRANNITEFHSNGDSSWDNCELCGGGTYNDQCDGDCCPGPDGTAKCIDCGHYSPISNLITIKEPGYTAPTKIKRCNCDWCASNETPFGSFGVQKNKGDKI